MNRSNPSLLSAMAGITDGQFAAKVLDAGAGGAILGSYNIDRQVLGAALKSKGRGRLEFYYPIENLSHQLIKEVQIAQSSHSERKIFLSIRYAAASSIRQIIGELAQNIHSSLIIEINAHCRQKEIISTGGGQALLKRQHELQKAIDILKGKDFVISVKARSPGLSCEAFAKQLADWGVDYFHIDAYTPGVDGPDFAAIRAAAAVEDIAVIGNNSITTPRTAFQVLSCGARAFSIARAALDNPKTIGSIARNLRNYPK
ncbi:MAG: tRNA-dihydrouridine synthase [Candidatus Hodarchaeales archaeon]